MIREVTFETQSPLERVESGNVFTGAHWTKVHRHRSAQHAVIGAALKSTFSPPRQRLEDGTPNDWIVIMTRIFPGTGVDSHDNLKSAFKWMVDVVACWIFTGEVKSSRMGRDDASPRIVWQYAQQQGGAGFYGVRVHIEDRAPGPDVIAVKGPLPRRMGAPSRRRPGPPAKGPTGEPPQKALEFRPAWAALPWQQDARRPDYEVVQLDNVTALYGDAPAIIELVDPRNQARVPLYRHPHVDHELGGKVWLYTDRKPAVLVSGPVRQEPMKRMKGSR